MNDKINGRTPEEIKKQLEKPCGDISKCERCTERYYCNLEADALALIQQLERERDAAVEDMTELMHLGKFCRHCKHLTEDGECTFDFAANKCAPWNCWQWRGVQEVE